MDTVTPVIQTPTNSPTTTSPKTTTELPIGIYIGIAVGVCAFVILISFLIYFVGCKKNVNKIYIQNDSNLPSRDIQNTRKPSMSSLGDFNNSRNSYKSTDIENRGLSLPEKLVLKLKLQESYLNHNQYTIAMAILNCPADELSTAIVYSLPAKDKHQLSFCLKPAFKRDFEKAFIIQ